AIAVAMVHASETEAADWMCDVWRGAQAGERLALRCLSSVLEVRLSGVELLRAATALQQVLRSCRRAARGPVPDSVTELVAAARAAAAHIGIAPGALHEPDAAERLRRRAGELLNATVANRLAPAELTWLTNLIELEMRATSILLGHLAERVGACDGRLISRLLPVLSAHEERVRDTRELVVRLPAVRELTRRT